MAGVVSISLTANWTPCSPPPSAATSAGRGSSSGADAQKAPSGPLLPGKPDGRPTIRLLDHDVIAGPAVEHVGAAIADQHIVAGPAVEGVVAGTANQDVVALLAVGGQPDGAGLEARGLDHVVAGLGVDRQ